MASQYIALIIRTQSFLRIHLLPIQGCKLKAYGRNMSCIIYHHLRCVGEREELHLLFVSLLKPGCEFRFRRLFQ